jgi:hypothetical protein
MEILEQFIVLDYKTGNLKHIKGKNFIVLFAREIQ